MHKKTPNPKDITNPTLTLTLFHPLYDLKIRKSAVRILPEAISHSLKQWTV